MSNDEKLALVHNGIIENYKELKTMLIANGYVFHSETDTEVAVHLISFEMSKGLCLEKAVISTVCPLEGAFAFCIMHKDFPDQIMAIRKNAPLVIGLGKEENYIASDIVAILGKVYGCIYVNDDELAIVSNKNVIIKNLDGKILDKKIEKKNI